MHSGKVAVRTLTKSMRCVDVLVVCLVVSIELGERGMSQPLAAGSWRLSNDKFKATGSRCQKGRRKKRRKRRETTKHPQGTARIQDGICGL